MKASFFCVSRCLLAILWLFGVLQLSESKIVCQVEPEDPKIVVLGVNSKTVSLKWETCIGDAGEIFNSFIFKRQKPDDVTPQQIASRGASDGGFAMSKAFEDFKKYRAFREQELQIYNVERNEKYIYTLSINYKTSGGVYEDKIFQVTVVVKVPPQISTAPTREVQLSLSSSSVQNYTLKCNASGDPHPDITWTKDGVPASQFNVSGYSLHLVDVQTKNAGSYICTASNGFGDNVTAIGIVNIRCNDCKTERVGITIRESFKDPFANQASSEFRNLESRLLSAIWGAYADNPGKQLHSVDVVQFSDGSVYAIVELKFGPSVSDPLKPLTDEMEDGKLGSFTVNRQLDVNPTTSPPTTKPTETTTVEIKGTPSAAGARTSGLTPVLWGVIGACIAFVIIVAIVILVCCIVKRKGKNNGGASKGAKYSEADGYRMNRQQPPPSGLGTASPAYVEASQYARRQDNQSKAPLNYAEVSFNNSSEPGRQPPPYSRTEYSEMSPEKRPPPAEGQKGEGGGFELWC